MIYQVIAKRWARGWELHIEGVGVTQSRALASAEAMARDYIALQLDVPDDEIDSIEVTVIPELPDDLAAYVAKAKEAVRRWKAARTDCETAQREAAAALKRAGLSGHEIAVFFEVSSQRVSQLLKE